MPAVIRMGAVSAGRRLSGASPSVWYPTFGETLRQGQRKSQEPGEDVEQMATTEETIVMVLDIPADPGWSWLPDCNILAVSSALCPERRERAIDEAQVAWRRSMLHIVDASRHDEDSCPHSA